MKQFLMAASLMLGILSSIPAYAAIPLVTDDTGTQGKGKFQIELSGEYVSDKEDGVREKTLDVGAALTYGVIDNVDIVFAIPYSSWRATEAGETTSESGITDLAIEAKWRFYEKDGLSFALKPGLTIPTGDDKKGLGNGRSTYYLYLIASKEMEQLGLHLNLAYIRNENKADDRKDIFHASVATTYEVMKGLKLVGDTGIETNPDRSSADSPAYVLVGLIYSPLENLDIGFGIKGGLTRPETDISFRGGITFRF